MFFFQATNLKFDYIFGDLTDTPVASDDDEDTSGSNDVWRFLRSIMEQALDLLEVGRLKKIAVF